VSNGVEVVGYGGVTADGAGFDGAGLDSVGPESVGSDEAGLDGPATAGATIDGALIEGGPTIGDGTVDALGAALVGKSGSSSSEGTCMTIGGNNSSPDAATGIAPFETAPLGTAPFGTATLGTATPAPVGAADKPAETGFAGGNVKPPALVVLRARGARSSVGFSRCAAPKGRIAGAARRADTRGNAPD